MVTAAKAGYSATFVIVGVTGTLEVISIGDIVRKYSVYDVTAHGIADRYRETIPGLYDIVETSMECNYTTAATMASVILLSEAAGLSACTLTYPDLSTTEFNAYISEVTNKTPLDAQLTFTIGLLIDGPITFKAYTPPAS